MFGSLYLTADDAVLSITPPQDPPSRDDPAFYLNRLSSRDDGRISSHG